MTGILFVLQSFKPKSFTVWTGTSSQLPAKIVNFCTGRFSCFANFKLFWTDLLPRDLYHMIKHITSFLFPTNFNSKIMTREVLGAWEVPSTLLTPPSEANPSLLSPKNKLPLNLGSMEMLVWDLWSAFCLWRCQFEICGVLSVNWLASPPHPPPPPQYKNLLHYCMTIKNTK